MTEFGNAISRLLKERDMSLRAAAAQGPVNPGYLSQVINGKRKGSAQLASALDRVLGTGGELTAIWEASEGSQVARDLTRTAAESFHGTDPAAQSSAGASARVLAAWQQGKPRVPVQVLTAGQAGHRIAAALEQRDPYYVRSRVLDLAGLARVRLLQDEPDEAMSVAAQALDAASGLRSRRTVRRLHTLAISAIDLYPRVRPVADFADSVRARLPL
jgi:DNA-binding transcriptional regulator YdaS (Cro superfamily)